MKSLKERKNGLVLGHHGFGFLGGVGVGFFLFFKAWCFFF